MLAIIKSARQWSIPIVHAQIRHFSFKTGSVNHCGSAVNYNGAVNSNVMSGGPSGSFLHPTNISLNLYAGIKHMGKLTLRCRHCYFAIKDEQKYVMCTAKPRHYAAEKQPGKKRKAFILTHATQGSSKKGDGRGSRHMWTQDRFRLDY